MRPRKGVCVGPVKIAAFGQSLDEARFFSIIPQGFAQLLDAVIKATVKIHKSVRGPDTLSQFIAGNYSPGPLQQNLENLEGLFL